MSWRHALCVHAFCVLGLSLAATGASAQELLVFVGDVDVGQKTKLSSGGISSSLCTALEKDRGITAMCAAEVRSLIAMAGQVGAFGQESPIVEGLMTRLGQVRFVIQPYLRRTETGGVKLLLRAFHAEAVTGVSVVPGRPAGRLVEVAEDGDLKRLLDRLPSLAKRTSAMLHEPRNTPGGPSDTPPPLEDKTKPEG